MTRQELRAFIIKEIKEKRPSEIHNAEAVADIILRSVQTKEQAEAFIKAYKSSK